MPKRNKVIAEELTIEKLIPGGQALGTLTSGKKVFLWNVLPGETIIEFRVTKEKTYFIEGVATNVTKTSLHRVLPKDDCYLSTSPWQILDYDYEKQQKVELLQEVFRQHGVEIPQNISLVSGGPYYYRNKMEYALYYSHDDNKIHLAFHERGSHRKVPIASSSIERPEIWQHAQEIINKLNAQGEDARKYQSLLLRCNQAGEVSGGLYENGKPHPQFPVLQDELLGQKYTYSPNGFFQINLPIYEKALQEISQWIQTQKVLDLYAGVGTIGLSVAGDRELTLVECDKSAYTEMVKNCQNTPKAKPVLAKSEEALNYIEPDQTVIVDPPRAGCMPEVVAKLLEVEPTRIVYLSCNPATQARDIKMLLQKYKIVYFQPFNFFPRTPHIENLIVLEK